DKTGGPHLLVLLYAYADYAAENPGLAVVSLLCGSLAECVDCGGFSGVEAIHPLLGEVKGSKGFAGLSDRFRQTAEVIAVILVEWGVGVRGVRGVQRVPRTRGGQGGRRVREIRLGGRIGLGPSRLGRSGPRRHGLRRSGLGRGGALSQ